MKRICKMTLLCVLCATLLCGCHWFVSKPADESVDVDYSQLVTAPVDVALADCISEQQVTTVIGVPMTLLGVYEEGTQAVFMSEDAACQVNINLMNQTRAVFDATITGNEAPVTVQEGLGETAYWFEETGELVVYAGGYSLGVAVIEADPTAQKTHTQQIATIILETLQPAQ